jgi:hypothetical protein
MIKTLSINDNRLILKYYNKEMPNTINKIKKRASDVIFRKMCKNIFDRQRYYKHFLSILCRKKMISPNNKTNHINTVKSKQKIRMRQDTRYFSPYYHF